MGGQNVVVLVDDSGSMASRMEADGSTTKMQAARQALQVVLGDISPEANVGLLALNSSGLEDDWLIPLGRVDPKQMKRAVQQLRASGSTPLGKKMKLGADELLRLRETEHYGTYRAAHRHRWRSQ